jgi:Fibronectin type III domain
MRLHRIAMVVAVAATAVAIPTPVPAAVTLVAPERVRVTNVTATQISFAWSQNTSGAVGTVRARIFQDGTHVATTPLVRYTASGLTPGATYTFQVIAADGVGSTSPASRTLIVTTRGPGVVPPGPSNLTAQVSATRVDLAFRQPDDSWDVGGYEVFDGANRVAFVYAGTWIGFGTVAVALRELAPGTSHEYRVQALRSGFGVSPSSNTVAATLPAKTDTTAPSTPGDLLVRGAAYACFSVNVVWTQSSDDTDAQAALDYEVLVNGVRETWVRGAGTAGISMVPVGTNVISVRAVDSSGNTSAAAAGTFVRHPSCEDES